MLFAFSIVYIWPLVAIIFFVSAEYHTGYMKMVENKFRKICCGVMHCILGTMQWDVGSNPSDVKLFLFFANLPDCYLFMLVIHNIRMNNLDRKGDTLFIGVIFPWLSAIVLAGNITDCRHFWMRLSVAFFAIQGVDWHNFINNDILYQITINYVDLQTVVR